jgi:hypothetical protein
MSQSGLSITLGLGEGRTIKNFAITWPSGTFTVAQNTDANQAIEIQKGHGGAKISRLARSQ